MGWWNLVFKLKLHGYDWDTAVYIAGPRGSWGE